MDTQNPRSGSDDAPAVPEAFARAITLLRSWRKGDEAEQRETWGLVKRALDEDRLSGRKLFPKRGRRAQ